MKEQGQESTLREDVSEKVEISEPDETDNTPQNEEKDEGKEENTSSDENALTPISRIDISFQYQRASTHASNQIAIWAENENAEIVKTILVTDFTARRRGYLNREDALSHWVEAVNPEAMSDAEIDAVSSATPSSGELSYSWDLLDENGIRVPDGEYTIRLEGTLYWESNVLFTARINTLESSTEPVVVEESRNTPEVHENADMIQSVEITIVR